MKAYCIRKTGGPEVLEIVQVPKPTPTGRDLLVKVIAVAVNPIDCKVRSTNLTNRPVGTPVDPPRIVGWDAAGIVEGVGEQVTNFKIGDEVYFAGSLIRPGSYAEYTLVDERITARKPKSLNWEQAAAVPLCTLTMWEALIEGAKIPFPSEGTNPNVNKSILVVGGAGGVGSSVIQFSKTILKFGKVIATASRHESVEWCKKLGADVVVNHTNLKANLNNIGIENVHYVYVTVDLNTVWDHVMEVVKPTGTIIGITGFNGIDVSSIFTKRVTLVPELMFCRPMFNEEPERQGAILTQMGEYIDKGILISTQNKYFEWNQIKEAHEYQDSGKAIGKITLTVKF